MFCYSLSSLFITIYRSIMFISISIHLSYFIWHHLPHRCPHWISTHVIHCSSFSIIHLMFHLFILSIYQLYIHPYVIHSSYSSSIASLLLHHVFSHQWCNRTNLFIQFIFLITLCVYMHNVIIYISIYLSLISDIIRESTSITPFSPPPTLRPPLLP